MFLYRVYFLLHSSKMNLIKMQIPLDGCKSFLCVVKICVATIGVCVFYASASVGAFFIYKGEIIMPDYKTMYLDLFNSVTDAIEILHAAQKKAEETYVNSSENEGKEKNPIE